MNEFKIKYCKLVKEVVEGHIDSREFDKFIKDNSNKEYFKKSIIDLMDDKDPWNMVYAAGISIDYNIDMKKARKTLKYILRKVEFGIYTIEAENNLIKYRRKRLSRFFKKKNK